MNCPYCEIELEKSSVTNMSECPRCVFEIDARRLLIGDIRDLGRPSRAELAGGRPMVRSASVPFAPPAGWTPGEVPRLWWVLQGGELTPAQRAAISAHWSAQLRAKIAASAERERCRVVVDVEVD